MFAESLRNKGQSKKKRERNDENNCFNLLPQSTIPG